MYATLPISVQCIFVNVVQATECYDLESIWNVNPSFVEGLVMFSLICLAPGSSFILLSLLRPAHSLFQSEFSTECDLVVPLSIYSILYP